MSIQSTTDDPSSISINSYAVLCKGCKATQPLQMFLHKIDPTCYRVSLQCKRCLEKSIKHWRAHREDIRAARATRERDCERIACVCGISISARYRTQHCNSKRHLSVVAILRQHSALPSNRGASIIPASAPAAEQESYLRQEEIDDVIAAAEQEIAAYEEARRERRRSLPNSPVSFTALVATTVVTVPTADDLDGELPCAGPLKTP
jgi:hypothetical protein